MLRARVLAGLDRVRQQGKRLGRPKVAPKVESAIRTHLRAGIGILKVVALVGVGGGIVQRVKRESWWRRRDRRGDRWEGQWDKPAPHGRPSHATVANDQSRAFHARSPSVANIWRGRVTTNSVNASISLSTVIVPPCCFVTMS
jgi:hypothetical protein